MKASVALLASLLAVAAAASIKKPVTERSVWQEDLKDQYVQSLVGTKLTMAGKMHGLLDEQILQKNLDWGLHNSLQQYLQGHLRAGELNSLQLLSADCQQVAAAQTQSPAPLPDCQDILQEGAGFRWRNDKAGPVLGLAQLIPSKQQTYILFGEVALDGSWLRSHAPLVPLLKRMQAKVSSLEGAEGRILVQDEAEAKNFYPVLSSEDFWLNATPLSLSYLNNWLDEFIFLWLCGCGILFLLTLVAHQRQMFGQQKTKKAFLHWFEEQPALAAFKEQKISDYDDVKKILGEGWEKQQLDQRKLKDELHLTQVKLQHCEQKLLKTERLESDYSQLDSLALQMATTSPVLQGLLAKIQSQLEDLADCLRIGLTKPTQALAGFLHQWQKGIQEVSPRKFFRSLSETVNINGQNELERHLAEMEEAAQAVINMAVNAVMQAGKIQHRFQRIERHVQHWHLLSHGEASFQAPHFNELILKAQATLIASTELAKLHFDNRFPNDMDLPPVSIPDQLWVSVFYHLYTAAVTQAEGAKEATIQTVLRKREQQRVLVISALGHEGGAFSAKAKEHVKIVERLVREYAVKISVLPQLNGGLAGIALSFKDPEAAGLARSGIEGSTGSVDQI